MINFLKRYGRGRPIDPLEYWDKIFRSTLNTYKKKMEYCEQEKLDMIKEMYKKGLSLEFISDITKHSIEEIEEIVNQSKSKKIIGGL